MATLGERVKALRKEKHWNRNQLGDKLGVSGSAISMWEVDKRTPSTKMMEAMCDLFDVQYDYLVGKSEYRHAEDEILDRIAAEETEYYRLPKDEAELLERYRNANAEVKAIFLQLLTALDKPK